MSPCTKDSYSTSLLVQANWKRIALKIFSPFGATRQIPAPAPFLLLAPSKFRV